VASGDLLVGWFAEYNAPGSLQVSDPVNGAWTRAPGAQTFSGTGDIALYYVANSRASAGGLAVTVTAPGAAYLEAAVAEYSGVATTSPLDQVSSANGDSAAVDTGSTGPVPAGELVYSALVTGGGPGGETPGSSQGVPFTARSAVRSGSAYEQDITDAAAGSQDGTATLNQSTDWYAVTATFR
jgi:hypothetical protein